MAEATYEMEIDMWLDRLDVPIEDTINLERLSARLADMFAERGQFEPTENQAAALFEGVERRFKWADAGMRPFTQRTNIGAPLRFAVKGQRGSFGIVRAREFYQQRTGSAAPF